MTKLMRNNEEEIKRLARQRQAPPTAGIAPAGATFTIYIGGIE